MILEIAAGQWRLTMATETDHRSFSGVRSAIEPRSTKKIPASGLHSQTLNFHSPIVRRDVTDGGGRSSPARHSSLRAVYQINRKYDRENFKWMDTTRQVVPSPEKIKLFSRGLNAPRKYIYFPFSFPVYHTATRPREIIVPRATKIAEIISSSLF